MKKRFVVFALTCTIFVAQFFGIGISLPIVYAADLTGSTDADDPTIFNFITGFELTQTGPDDTRPPVLGNDVPQNGDFRMTYEFEIEQNSNLTAADYFYLDLPSYVHVPINVEDLAIYDSYYGYQVLTVSMLQGAGTGGLDAILVEFTPDLEAQSPNYDFTGEFWFEANFDADEVGEGGTITINFESGRASEYYAVDVNFIEDPPVLPSLDKNVSRSWNSAENRHYYTWTLDFNQEDVDVGDNVVITDELDFMTNYLFDSNPTNVLGTSNGSDLRYMEYIGNVTQTNGSAAYTVGYVDTGVANEAPVLTITFTEPVTERQTFTFQTALYANAYINGLNDGNRTLTFSNTADASTDLGGITSDSPSNSYTMDVINKIQVGAVDTVNRRITWRIEANPNDYIVDNAYVTDEIPDGLTLDESTITFLYDDGVTPASGSYSLEDNGTPANPDDDYYLFDLGNITEEVWIEFQTIIDEDEYYNQDNVTYRNDAYFHPPTGVYWYTRGRRDVPVTTDIIQKSSTAIDITDGIITWQLNINPNTTVANPVQLADLVVTDPIPDNITTSPATTNNGLSYISGSLTINRDVESEVTGATCYYDSVNNQIVVDFDPDDTSDGGDIIQLEYIVTYQTQIVDGYIYKRNEDSSVTNTVNFTSYNAGSDSDSATRNINPDMLQKSFVSYDYDTHYFRWHIHVNPNNNELTNCVVTDYISDDMTYVPGTFEILDSSSNPYTGGIFTATEHDPVMSNPEDASENITYTLEYVFSTTTITDSYDIYFETEYIDYDQLSDNHLDTSSDYVEVENTAYLVHDELPSNTYVSIADSERFTSSVVEKAPEYTNGNQYIDWVVTINKNQINILGPSPVPDPETPPVIDGPIIYDTLQEGLVLDLESIKLYNAVVNADNTITVDRTTGSADEVSFDAASQITYDANTRQITFAFEDTISTCYVMTFRTYIESGHNRDTFENTASFHALAGDETNTSNDEDVLFATGGGYAAANIGHLLITKVDAESGLPLAGARFELIDSNGTVVDVQETDASGEALFEFIFFDRDYYYRESEAPYGYSGDTVTTTYFTLDSTIATNEGDDDPDRTHTATITNTANPVTVQFMKYAEDGSTGLQGAVFSIYDTTAPGTEVARTTSDVSGLVTFSNLNANRDYEIREISPPIGYLLDTTVLAVSVTVGDTPFTPSPSSITNLLDSTAVNIVIFTKYAQDGATPLPGCVFGLYSSLNPTILLATATSQTDGSVTFNGIPVGNFIIRELSTLDGYDISTDALTVAVGATPGTYITTPASLTNYLTPPERSVNPQTGDSSLKINYIFVIILVMLYSILIGVYVLARKKQM